MMIHLELHNETHIALHGAYDYRAEIKALADYPDVKWSAEARAWLVHVALLLKLYETLGDSIAPASPEFWMTLPLPKAAPKARQRRRTRRQIMAEKRVQQEEASEVGRTIVNNKGGLRW